MLKRFTGAIRVLDERIGWNRIGFVLSLIVVGVALAALYRLVRHVDPAKVSAALWDKSPERIIAAAAFTAGAYLTYTLYDLFALRTIGKPHVPYRVAALAGFASYAIGHNIGATVFTGGAVRFRIYSAWGLTLVDVAKMAFITGLTFWLGNAFVLGLGMAFEPAAASAIDQLPAWVNRVIALAGLGLIGLYIAWLVPRPRVIGRGGIVVKVPDAPLTLVQIGIGVLDLGCASLAMYVLLPDTPAIAFSSLLVVFVLATLLGFISHAPGSIGVLDAALLVALPQFDKEAVIASLLLFRLLYFVVPFALALAILGVRELRIALKAGNAAAGRAEESRRPHCFNTVRHGRPLRRGGRRQG